MATYYVSKSDANNYAVGNDSNNGTSKLTPWLTISKAITMAVDGDTIWVNDGTYVDLELGASNVLSVNSTKSLKIFPQNDYKVILQSTAASAQIVLLTGTSTNEMVFGKFVIDCEIPGAPGTYQPTGLAILNTTGDCTLTIAGTEIKNASTQNVLNSRRRGIVTLNLVFSGKMAQGVASTISGADVAAMTVTVTGVTLNNVEVSANALARVLDFTRLSTSAFTYSLTVQNVTGSIFAPGSLGSGSSIALLVSTGIDGVIAEGFNATYTAYNSGATCYGIYIKNSARGAVATANRPIIRNNRITGNAPSEYVISAGDATTAYDVDNPLVYGNTITVPYYSSATPHAVVVGNVTGGLVYGNTVNGSYVAFLLGINQGALVTGNISVGCYGFALYAKGCGATTSPTFAHNTVVLTNTYGPARNGALGVAIQGATNNTATLFQHNIIYALSDLYRYVEVGTSQTATFVKNDYYSAGPLGFSSPWSYQASTYSTFAAWQSARETDALNLDPLFLASTDYRLQASSPMKRIGAFLSLGSKGFQGRSIALPSDLGAHQTGSGDAVSGRTSR